MKDANNDCVSGVSTCVNSFTLTTKVGTWGSVVYALDTVNSGILGLATAVSGSVSNAIPTGIADAAWAKANALGGYMHVF